MPYSPIITFSVRTVVFVMLLRLFVCIYKGYYLLQVFPGATNQTRCERKNMYSAWPTCERQFTDHQHFYAESEGQFVMA